MTTFMPPPPAATFLAFHPQDNNIIAIGMDDSTIQIYNVRVDEVVMNYCKCLIWLWQIIEVHYSYSNLITQVKSKLKGHSKRITGLAFSHVLNVLVSSGADAQVQLITTFFCFYNVFEYPTISSSTKKTEHCTITVTEMNSLYFSILSR